MVFCTGFTAVLLLAVVYISPAFSGLHNSSPYSLFIPFLPVGSFCLYDYFEMNMLT